MSAPPPVTLVSLSAAMDGARVAIADVVSALRSVGAESDYRRVKVLIDHREDLVAERTRMQARLRWHLHELMPELDLAPKALNKFRHLDRVAAELANCDCVVAAIAAELVERIRELTVRCNQLEREIAAVVTRIAPTLLDLPGCGVLSAATPRVQELHERMLLGLRVGDPHDEVLGAWLAKESVRDVYLTEDSTDAAVLLDKAIRGCADDPVLEIQSLGRTLAAWRTEILNHHHTGASNGPTEGLNPCMKKVKRAGHRFRSFEHYRLRVLLHAGGITWPARPHPPRIRTHIRRSPHPNA